MPSDGADDKSPASNVDSEGFVAVGKKGRPVKPSEGGPKTPQATVAASGRGMADGATQDAADGAGDQAGGRG